MTPPAGNWPEELPGPLDPGAFLDRYWQRAPVLIRDGLQPAALDRETLLDCAADEGLASRLVQGSLSSGDWRVAYGPFSGNEIPSNAARDWTLLVQDLDKTLPQVHEILSNFRFLPDWLLDDVMVSLAGPGGSVGPHVDAYDVFLVQAAGTRVWELASDFDPADDPRFELAVLKEFSPRATITCQPGDVLYLPPGIAHHGVADSGGDPCQTWSVGLRAPSGPELMADRAGWLAEHAGAGERLMPMDFDRDAPERLDPALLARARKMLEEIAAAPDVELADWLGCAVTGYRLWEDDALPARSDHALAFSAATRLAWHDYGHDGGMLYVNGMGLACPPALARRLCRDRGIADPRDLDAAGKAVIRALREAGELMAVHGDGFYG